MSEYENYKGQKIESIESLKEEFDNFNHITILDHTQLFCKSNLRGWFYFNIVTRDTYAISEHGIAKFNSVGLDWVINDEKALTKFMNVNKKISETYAPDIPEVKSNVKSKLGL